MATGRPMPGDRLRILSDAGDQICAGSCKGQVATLIMDDGSDCPFFVAVDDGPMSWAKVTAFETARLEPFDPERVRSAFRAAFHCVTAKSWDRLGELEAQMRSTKVQDGGELWSRVAQKDLQNLPSQNLALIAYDAAGRSTDSEDATFLSLGDSHHNNQRSPSKGFSQGSLNQGLPWDNKNGTEVKNNETLQDNCNPYPRAVPFEGGHKTEGIAEWMINKCEIDPEDARRYAAALVDIGCDRPKDLAEMDHEDWPIQVKRIHMKKMMRALSFGTRPQSGDSTRFSVNSSQRGLDSSPYRRCENKSPKHFFPPFSSRRGHPELAPGNGSSILQDHNDVPLDLHVHHVPKNSQSSTHYATRYRNYEPHNHGVGGTFGRHLTPRKDASPRTLQHNPVSLDNTAVTLVQHSHYCEMQEQGSLVRMRSNGNSPVRTNQFPDTSYSPLRRYAMSPKEDVGKMWGGGVSGVGLGSQLGGGHFYSGMNHPQGGRRSPFSQQLALDAASSPTGLGHSDRQLAELVHAGARVSEQPRRLALLDWR